MSDLIAVKVRVAVTDEVAMREVATALEQAGLRLRQQIPLLGVVTGDVEASRLDALAALDGVISAEPEGGVQLPPLDKDTPQ